MKLTTLIKERIRAEGPIPFAEFMELALYHPRLGYYASGRRRSGVAGDYYTSPQAHPVYGALLALQLERFWQLLGSPARFHVIEAGTGDGRLARDILEFSRRLGGGFASALFYVAVDVNVGTIRELPLHAPDVYAGAIQALPQSSPEVGAGEIQRLPPQVPGLDIGAHRDPRLRAVTSRGLPFRGLAGCILSNEMLDALPVHRLLVRGGKLMETYVALEGEDFIEVPGEPSAAVRDLIGTAAKLPPEGTTLEICPAVWDWTGEASRALDRGFVLTIDYGYWDAPAEGTVASYRHHMAASPYEKVGRQDLTAHVDFGAAMEAGQRAGLEPVGLVSQRRFLLDLGLSAFREAAARLGLPQQHHHANQMAMLDLIRPEGLGGFGVMVQCKGVGHIKMGDLALTRPVREQLAAGELPAPLLSREHIPLLKGRYAHLGGV